jgi:DnaJ-class molecular chaperone
MAARKKPEAPTACATCSGHGATDLVPMTPKNQEKHMNKYGLKITAGIGGTHMGATCTNCGGTGTAK